MNFTELKAELAARGFDYLSDTRLGRYIGIGYSEACAQALWPFLAASQSGTMPMTITDLGTVESVEYAAEGRKLVPIDRRILTDEYPGLSDVGTALWYYLSTAGQVAVYPAQASGSFTVRYYKRPATLTGTDTPVIPTEWHYVIVDYAAAKAYSDNGDVDQALAARQEGDRTIGFMLDALIDPHADRSSGQTIISWSTDG